MNTHVIIQLTEAQTLFKEANFANLPDGMLPIADKPLVSYLIEHLAEQGHQSITLAVSNATAKSITSLGTGDFWGISMKTINRDIHRSIDLRLQQLSHNKIDEVMLLQCHSMQDVALSAKANSLKKIACSNTKEIHQQLTRETAYQSYDLDTYFEDNLLALSDHQRFLLDGFELKENLFVNSGCHYPNTSITQRDGVIYIGENAHLQTSCDLSGDTVVGKGTIVDDNVILNRTVILPNTYIGKNLNLSNCVVGQNWIYNTMTKGMISIEDKALLASTNGV